MQTFLHYSFLSRDEGLGTKGNWTHVPTCLSGLSELYIELPMIIEEITECAKILSSM